MTIPDPARAIASIVVDTHSTPESAAVAAFVLGMRFAHLEPQMAVLFIRDIERWIADNTGQMLDEVAVMNARAAAALSELEV